MFRCERKRFCAVWIDEKDLVVIRVEADAGLGNIVGDDEVALFPDEFLASVRFKVFRFCGETDERAGEAEFFAGGAENVGSADEFECKPFSAFFDFLRFDYGGCIIGHSGGKHGDVHFSYVPGNAFIHLRSSLNRDIIDIFRHIEIGRAGDKHHGMAFMGKRPSEAVAHLPG